MILTFNPLGPMQKKGKENLLIYLWRDLFIYVNFVNLEMYMTTIWMQQMLYSMKITNFAIAVAHLSTGAKKIFIDFLCAFMPILLTLEPLCMYECVWPDLDTRYTC